MKNWTLKSRYSFLCSCKVGTYRRTLFGVNPKSMSSTIRTFEIVHPGLSTNLSLPVPSEFIGNFSS